MQRNEPAVARLPLICTLLCLAAGSGGEALGAEFQFKPSLALSEELNDNIFETATDERTDFVTRVQPGLALGYRGGSVGMDLGYGFNYRYYARGSREDEKNHNLTLKGSAELAPNFLFIEISDTLSRVSLDVARDVTAESQFLNQTDQNRGIASSYLLWHLGEKSALKTGYRYSDTRYWSISGSRAGIDKSEHRGFAELSHKPLSRLSLSTGYSYSSVETEIVAYRQHDLSAGCRYEYAQNSFLFGGVGNSWQSFSDSRSASNLFWSAGVTHDFGLLVATVETKVQYTEDPLIVSLKETSYTGRLEKALEHGKTGFSGSYTEYDDTRGGGADRDKTAFSLYGNWEISQACTAGLSVTGDRVSGATVNQGLPYHLGGNVVVSYLFNYDITAALSYNYVDYRRELDSAAGAKQTNRVLFEVKKVF